MMNSPQITATFLFEHCPPVDRRVEQFKQHTHVTVEAGDELQLQKAARQKFYEHFGLSNIVSVQVIERRATSRLPMTAMQKLFAEVEARAQARGVK